MVGKLTATSRPLASRLRELMNSAATAAEDKRENNNRDPAHLDRSRFDRRGLRRRCLLFGGK